ncbi:MAG: hypothetical protein ACI9WC_001138 [Arenicella sp.]|jgi:hypothetical protein
MKEALRARCGLEADNALMHFSQTFKGEDKRKLPYSPIVSFVLPRLAGVTSTRQRWLGARTPW